MRHATDFDPKIGGNLRHRAFFRAPAGGNLRQNRGKYASWGNLTNYHVYSYVR